MNIREIYKVECGNNLVLLIDNGFDLTQSFTEEYVVWLEKKYNTLCNLPKSLLADAFMEMNNKAMILNPYPDTLIKYEDVKKILSKFFKD